MNLKFKLDNRSLDPREGPPEGSPSKVLYIIKEGCLEQVGNGIELEAVGLQFEPYRWRRPCGVSWDSSRIVVVIKLRRTSALLAISKSALFRHRILT